MEPIIFFHCYYLLNAAFMRMAHLLWHHFPSGGYRFLLQAASFSLPHFPITSCTKWHLENVTINKGI